MAQHAAAELLYLAASAKPNNEWSVYTALKPIARAMSVHSCAIVDVAWGSHPSALSVVCRAEQHTAQSAHLVYMNDGDALTVQYLPE